MIVVLLCYRHRPSKLPRVQVFGLTGGIASGKSTVRRMLEARGAVVLDADAIYHELLKPKDGQASELARAVAARFPGVLQQNGSLDRQKLGALVFKNAGERDALGAITHPAIARETGRRMRVFEEQGCERVLYDVPLLFERGMEDAFDGVIVVWVPYATQVDRLMARDGIDEAAAKARLAAQLPLDEKRQRARWVVDNSGSLADTEAQVVALWRSISSSG